MNLEVGEKIKFYPDKYRYTVRAVNEQFAICTKASLYTVIDFRNSIRGTEGNLPAPLGTKTDKQCQEILARLTSGETKLSCRDRISTFWI